MDKQDDVASPPGADGSGMQTVLAPSHTHTDPQLHGCQREEGTAGDLVRAQCPGEAAQGSDL